MNATRTQTATLRRLRQDPAPRSAVRSRRAVAAGVSAQSSGLARCEDHRRRRNFGCGSSREAAVYALRDYGIRCVIAASFGDIFSGNAVQNALLTAIASEEETAKIMAALARQPGLEMTIDLERQTILCGRRTCAFSIDAVRRTRLLNGWDDIALTETYGDQITAFAADDRIRRPWAAPSVRAKFD